jgi:hypothetical protein
MSGRLVFSFFILLKLCAFFGTEIAIFFLVGGFLVCANVSGRNAVVVCFCGAPDGVSGAPVWGLGFPPDRVAISH